MNRDDLKDPRNLFEKRLVEGYCDHRINNNLFYDRKKSSIT